MRRARGRGGQTPVPEHTGRDAVVPVVGDSSGHARVWRGMIAGSLALAVVMAFAPIASAATLTNAWKAKIGSAGVNGSATLSLYLSGTGSIALKVAKLKPSTSLALTVLKTSCSGNTLLTLASIKTSSAGAATRTSALTVAQVNLIKAATIGTSRIAVRVGSSTTAKCGVFVVQPIPAYLAATVTVGKTALCVTATPSSVLAANFSDGNLSRVDPATNSVLSVVPLNIAGREG